jgi:hypothetical protein
LAATLKSEASRGGLSNFCVTHQCERISRAMKPLLCSRMDGPTRGGRPCKFGGAALRRPSPVKLSTVPRLRYAHRAAAGPTAKTGKRRTKTAHKRDKNRLSV